MMNRKDAPPTARRRRTMAREKTTPPAERLGWKIQMSAENQTVPPPTRGKKASMIRMKRRRGISR